MGADLSGPFDRRRYKELMSVYRDGLLNDTLPFWINNAVDRERGGFTICLDRAGRVMDTDKGMWQNCRFTWLLATLYNTVEKREEWLDLARHGIEFIRRAGFDRDGRMFFLVTRDGRPLRKRRYVFTECFAAMAFAAYAAASGSEAAADKAVELFNLAVRHFTEPGLTEPKFNAETRPMRSLAAPMITICVAQTLRENLGDSSYNEHIDRCVEEIEKYFMNHEDRALMENVGPKGEIYDHFDGRLLSPPDAMELAFFLLHEARCRNGASGLISLATTMIDWMWERGWDKEHGGILYFTDLEGRSVQEYWHDMKFWWCHCETINATLLAYRLTGDAKYAERHRLVHDWSYRHFPDREFGEWFGYLHRDGSVSVTLKGNWWKGPFHLPRMQWYCWRLLEEMLENKTM
jgi:N-acylglucosamine 2-epimerase